MSKLNITLGSDPELMLFDRKEGRIVSSLSVIKNDKHDPIMLDKTTKMYSDNVLVEAAFNPCYTTIGVVNKIRDTLALAHANLGVRYALLPIASHNFSDLPPRPDDALVKDFLTNPDNKGDAIPEEWKIGCNPNFSVYQGDVGEPRDQSPFPDSLRTGSFHIHIGNADYKNPDASTLLTAMDKANAVKLMDIFVGVPSVAFDKDPSSAARRKLYGRAGEFRPTPYGIEYRVLGNYALRSPTLTELVFELTAFAMQQFDIEGKAEECINMIGMDRVVKCINENDVSLAYNIMRDSWLPATLWKKVAVAKNVAASDTLKEWGI